MSQTSEWLLGKSALRLTRAGTEDFVLEVTDGEGEPRRVEGTRLGGAAGWVELKVGGRRRRARVLRHGQDLWVAVAGETYRLRPPRRGGRDGGGGGEGRVESPMPGTVLEVLVADGQAVEADQDLLVVEAMKMEHRLRAGRAGVVTGLTVSAGEKVDGGVALAEIVDPPDPG